MSAMKVYLGVFFWLSAVVAILDVKSRGRLGRVESATNGVGIRLNAAMTNQDSGYCYPDDISN